MGAVKSFGQDFLDTIGYELGYDWEDVRAMSISEMTNLMERVKLNRDYDSGR